MLRKRAIPLFVFLVSCLVLAPTAKADGLLINGTFESGSISPWFQDLNFGTESWNMTSAVEPGGPFEAPDAGNKEVRQNFVVVATAVTLFAFDFFSYFPNQSNQNSSSLKAGSYFGVGYSDATYNESLVLGAGLGGSLFDLTSNFDVTSNIDLTSNMAAGESLVAFSVAGNSSARATADGKVSFDAVSIITNTALVPEPATLLLLGAGLVGLAGRIRRKTQRMTTKTT